MRGFTIACILESKQSASTAPISSNTLKRKNSDDTLDFSSNKRLATEGKQQKWWKATCPDDDIFQNSCRRRRLLSFFPVRRRRTAMPSSVTMMKNGIPPRNSTVAMIAHGKSDAVERRSPPINCINWSDPSRRRSIQMCSHVKNSPWDLIWVKHACKFGKFTEKKQENFRSTFFVRFQNRRAKWRKREKALGRESPNYIGPHDLDAFRHQMSTYLSNALTNSVNASNGNSDRAQLPVPPPHYLPFLMGHLDDKVLTRLPPNSSVPNFGLLYHQQHPSSVPNVNISSASPTSSSSNSSTSDLREQTSPYHLARFDESRRVKLEIQDTTAWDAAVESLALLSCLFGLFLVPLWSSLLFTVFVQFTCVRLIF